VGIIDLGLSVNKRMFNKQLSGIAGSAKSSVMSAFKPLGKMIGTALGTAAVAGFTKSCLSLGSDLAEVQNVVDVTFKSMSSGINSFAQTAITQFGLSETAAKKYSGTFGAMSKAMGLSESAAYEMSTAVTGLTGDVASFFNLSADEAYTKLKSIWTGETETLKDLGVVMTQTALDNYALNNGFGKTTKNMTEQEKLMLRYRYVMSSLSDAQGDFARTQDSWANQTRVLSLQFESLKATLGQGFINVFTPILKGLNMLLGKLQTVANAFKSFTNGLMNKDGIESALSGGTTEAASLGAGIADAGDEAVTAAKKAKKALAGFDEINTLSFGDSEDSAASDVGAGSGSIDLSGINEANSAVDSMAENMGKKFRGVINSVGNHFKKVFGSLKKWGTVNFAPIFSGIFDGLSKNAATLMQTLEGIFADIQTLGEPLKEYFAGDFTIYLQAVFSNLGIIINGLFDTFNTVFSDIWNLAVFPMLQNFIILGLPVITQFATECWNTLGTLFTEIKEIFDTLWSEGVTPALSLISKVWEGLLQSMSDFWAKWGAPIFSNFRTAIRKTGDTLQNIWGSILKPIWDNIMKVVDELWTAHLKPLVDNFLDFVGEFVNGALEIYNKFISPVVNWLVNVFGPPVSKVFNTIVDTVGKMVGNIVDAVSGIITALKGVVQFVSGVFSGDWGKAWEGIKNIFKGVWDALVSIIKTPINAVIGLINGMLSAIVGAVNAVIRALNTISFDIPDWVPGIGGMHFGFDFGELTPPQIPYLAKGGLAYQPTLAMVGDNKNARTDPEVISPLSKLQGIISQSGGNGNDRIYELLMKIYELLRQLDLVAQFNIDGRMLEEVIIQLMNKNSFITNGR
jgi:phage-related protein